MVQSNFSLVPVFLFCSTSIFHHVLTGEVVHAKRSNKNTGMPHFPPYPGQSNPPFLRATKQAKHLFSRCPSAEQSDKRRWYNCFACGQRIWTQSLGHLPSLLKPLCCSVLKYFRLQPGQTGHSKRDTDCICTCSWFKHRLCSTL